MRGVTRLPRDVWAGLVFVAIGLVALIQVRRYPIGTLTAMGPGYFPLILSVLLVGLGLGSAGFVLSVMIGHGHLRRHPVQVIGSALVLSVGATLVFVQFLGMPIRPY